MNRTPEGRVIALEATARTRVPKRGKALATVTGLIKSAGGA